MATAVERQAGRKGFRREHQDGGGTVVDLRTARRQKRHSNRAYMAKVRERLIRRAVYMLNKDHAYIERGNDVLIVSMSYDYRGRLDLKFRNRAALVELYDSQQLRLPKVGEKGVRWEHVNPVTLWAKHADRRNLRGMVNAPGQFLGPEWLNVWHGWGTSPLLKDGFPNYSGEGCPRILHHIAEVWCKGSEPLTRWVLAWFAQIVQQPTRKPDTAIMAYSGQGTGKSFIVEHVLSKILGTGYGYEDSPEFLTAKFNRRVAGKLLIYADEAFFHGDKGSADRLKAFVSKKVITIEEKGKDSFETDHYARIFATTNRDHALSIDNDDRRWLIMEVSEDRKKDYGYFAALESEVENGGVEAFHAFLMNPSLLDGVNLREVPETPAAVKQKVQSLQSVEAFVYECLHARTAQVGFGDSMRTDWDGEGATPGKADWHHAYLEWCKAQRDNYPRRDSQFAEILRKLLPSVTEGRNGSKPRFWKLPPIEQARTEFAAWIGCPDDDAALRALWSDPVEFDGSSDRDDDDVVILPTTAEAQAAWEDEQIPF